MSEQQAIKTARQSLPAYAIPENAPLISSMEAYIELEKSDESDECIAIRDMLVWLIKFEKPKGWIEFAIDQDELVLVRVDKSR